VRAMRRVERYVDVIVLARGGGSAEDLAAFNDEQLARAIAACKVPVVSAVGHEVDFTIADFVADVRAPTPSGAAELVVPSLAEEGRRLEECTKRLMRDGKRILGEARLKLDSELQRGAQALHAQAGRRRRALDAEAKRLLASHPRARLSRDRAALDQLARRLLAWPGARLARERNQLVTLHDRLGQRAQQALEGRKRGFALAAGKLQALSPLAVLERGYALALGPGGHVLTDATAAQPGDRVTVKLARGELDCRVQSPVPEGADD